MLYTVNVDNSGYILSVAHTPNDNIDIDLDAMDINYLNAYKLIDDIPILDEVRKAEIIAAKDERAKQTEISELKANLDATDYIMAETFEQIMSLDNAVTFIVDIIRILKEFSQTYADTIANRKLWRQRIKELEKQ